MTFYVLLTQSLLKLERHAMNKNLCKEIMHIVKVLTSYIGIVVSPKFLEGIGQHVEDVTDEYAFVNGHFTIDFSF